MASNRPMLDGPDRFSAANLVARNQVKCGVENDLSKLNLYGNRLINGSESHFQI